MERRNFSYRYTVIDVTATLERDLLRIKQGLRTFEVPLAQLKGLHVKVHSGQMQELILGYQKAPGKLARVRSYSNLGEESFTHLVDALVEGRPEIDLRGLGDQEAHRRLGAANTEKVAMVLVPLILVLVMGALGAPLLVHGLDDGEERVDVAQLSNGPSPRSRNLVLSGELALDYSMKETVTRKGTTTVSYFIPVVPTGWTDKDPVTVVMQTGELSDLEAERLADRGSWKCTLRDVLWEGLSGSNRSFFEKNLGLNVSSVRLVELNTGSRKDLLIFGIIMGITALVIGGVMTVIIIKRR